MKAFLRSAAMQAALGWLLGVYLRLILRTVRWRHENLAPIDPHLADRSQGVVALLWHGRIPLSLAVAPQMWRKQAKVLVSPSADGEFIARALAMSRFPSIRASSAKPGDAAKMRQAVAAIREATAWVAAGGGLVVTPDGPRGPNEVIQPGALQIARRTGAPVLLMGIAARPALRLERTWDRVMFGLPFGRGAVVWDGPVFVPTDADEAAISALITDWSARLSTATRRAETLVGHTG
ncbi:MAG: lysophospholipid acyltransferase family protein [Phenylobacterium sp.]